MYANEREYKGKGRAHSRFGIGTFPFVYFSDSDALAVTRPTTSHFLG
jgi:hypothetical protein